MTAWRWHLGAVIAAIGALTGGAVASVAGEAIPVSYGQAANMHLAQATLPTPGGSPFLQAPPTVIPQNPSDSRAPNLGSGGGTLGRPSAIQNPLGYDDSLYFRRPKVPSPPPVVLPPPRKRVDPPSSASTPPVVRRKQKPKSDDE